MLEYAGGTPQIALTGTQRGVTTIDHTTLDSATGALQTRPDIAESYIRTRNLAKQLTLQCVMEERMAVASRIAQHKHDPQLLIPRQPVDVFRTPNRKDHHG